MTIPPLFVERMRALLGTEAEALLAALAQPSPSLGLRANTLKLRPEDLRALLPWRLEPLPWCPSGFLVPADERPGRHPLHAAGLFYLQEPSAMAVAEALAQPPGIEQGELVLDLAAAPGGKSTHLASLLAGSGLLVCNELERGRTRALAENLERWGARRTLITSEEPERLAQRWGAVFDRVLLDAPCSGEGMFRKSEAAASAWSPEVVRGCSLRQGRALRSAAALVRPGGLLAFSTCTFAPEENEELIARFLSERADFSLVPLRLPGVQPARPEWLPPELFRADMSGAARLWPHLGPGEGHFVALLRREDGPPPQRETAQTREAPRAARDLWQAFVESALVADPAAGWSLSVYGDRLYAAPPQLPPLDGLRIVRAGLWLGTLRRDRFEPSHSLALALKAEDALRRFALEPHDELAQRYLQGHPIADAGPRGWLLVTIAGYPLGWGRRAAGTIKNAYPKGLRRHG